MPTRISKDEWITAQRRLGVVADGLPGVRTYTALILTVANRPARPLDAALGAAMAKHIAAYGIDTRAQLPAFLGQVCHESGGFVYLREIWGPTPAQAKYEGNSALGNTHPGDGKLYLGRGLVQVTGRKNYVALGKRTGLPFEANPSLLEQPEYAVLSACDWWVSNGCAKLAEAGDLRGLSRLVNRGSAAAKKPALGEDERIQFTHTAQHALGFV